MRVVVELDGYEMCRLFPENTMKKAKLFAQNIIDRYCNGEYLCEEELVNVSVIRKDNQARGRTKK